LPINIFLPSGRKDAVILQGPLQKSDATILLVDHQGTIPYNALYPELIGKKDRNELFKRMTDGPNEETFEAVGNIGSYRIISYRKIKLPHELTPYMYVRAAVPHDKALEQANRDLIINISVLTSLMLLMFGCAGYAGHERL